MQIHSLRLFRIDIPFKLSFGHHSATRSQTESIWVEARTTSGVKGIGEGCPRAYVSAETLASAQRFFRQVQPEILAITCLEQLRAWVKAHRTQIDAQPAAWCAIELALLDALAREAGQSLEALLGLPELRGGYTYSAVLGTGPAESFQRQLAQYLALGFKDFKLKLSGEADSDQPRLQALHEAGVSFRADANNLWDQAASAIDYLEALGMPLNAIEEPLRPARRYQDLVTLSARLDIPVIGDESCLNLQDLDQLSPPEAFIVNLRVSKMGGLLRALELAEAARAKGIPVILGAQVGETSLLTRAALSLVSACQPLAMEGAFGTHLLSRDLVEAPLMFGKAGHLAAPAPAPGFGLEVADAHPCLIPLE